MISNSKSFLIQAFIALTILASSLTFSGVTVNAAPIAPARFARQGGAVGGILIDAANRAVQNLCNSIFIDLTKLEENVSSSSTEVQDIKRVIFGDDVVCNGTFSTPDAATVDTTPIADPAVDITPQAIVDGQTVANADASLATDVSQDDVLSAVQDACGAIQEFITADCKDTDICLKIATIANAGCITAINGATPTSTNR